MADEKSTRQPPVKRDDLQKKSAGRDNMCSAFVHNINGVRQLTCQLLDIHSSGKGSSQLTVRRQAGINIAEKEPLNYNYKVNVTLGPALFSLGALSLEP